MADAEVTDQQPNLAPGSAQLQNSVNPQQPIQNPIGGVLDKVNPVAVAGNVAGAITSPGQYQATEGNEASAITGPAFTQPALQRAVTQLPQTAKAAQQGIEQGAKAYARDVSQPASDAESGAASVATTAQNLQGIASTTYQNALQDTNTELLKAEAQLKDLTANATIDPNNYMKQLGVSGGGLAAIGMLVSGAGSGLTGQPNMAMEVLQKNIQRDIQAQQQTYLQKLQAAQQQRGIVMDSATRATMAAQAHNLAATVTLSGYKTYLDAAMTKGQAESGIPLGNVAKNQIQQSMINSINQVDQTHAQAVKSHNGKMVGPLGELYKNVFSNQPLPTKSIQKMAPDSYFNYNPTESNTSNQSGTFFSEPVKSFLDVVGSK